MPKQKEHERVEDQVEVPGEAEHAARSLEDAVDSNATLEGYYAMNDVKPPKGVSRQPIQRDNPPPDADSEPEA